MSRSPLDNRKDLYLDFHKDLTRHPVSNDLARKANEEAVKESIRNLILTDRGERPFQPELGCEIRKLLFNPITPDLLFTIKSIIETTLRQYEPRADVLSVDVTSAIDDNAIQVTIVFNVINSEDDIVFTTILKRVR